jgi:ActR/RegA family two-component response regulator
MQHKHSKRSVLVVDEEESVRFTLEHYLNRSGYRVHAASCLESARSVLATTDFEVAVVDRLLTGDNDAPTLFEHIRKIQPLCQVILTTSYPSFESTLRAMSCKASAYLVKPLRKEDILPAVKEASLRHTRKSEAQKIARFYDLLFFKSHHPTAILDLEMRVSDVNQSFTELFGYRRRDIAGQVLPMIPGGHIEGVLDALKGLENIWPLTELTTPCMDSRGNIIERSLKCILFRDRGTAEDAVMVIFGNSPVST